ncbi:MAG: phosphate ABC transporter ATP-binding protein [Oligoflexus sp.]
MKDLRSNTPFHPSVTACRDGICAMDENSYVDVQGISVRYGNKTAVKDVSLQLAPCSILALIGPSGCGKTSFLNCFNRLNDMIPQAQVSGSIRIGEWDVNHAKTDVMALRRRVGMVFQKPNPFPLSIWKNIALPLKQHGVRAKVDIEMQVENVLREVGLWEEVKDRLRRPALALSGGQQQRLCIARTLALKPELVLFDEPCSALDPISSQVIEKLIAKLRRKLAVIIVTHNLAQARRIADLVGVFWPMEGSGRLLEYGETQQIFESPVHRQTSLYLQGVVG